MIETSTYKQVVRGDLIESFDNIGGVGVWLFNCSTNWSNLEMRIETLFSLN